MKRILAAIALAFVLIPGVAQAELREVKQVIYGMD